MSLFISLAVALMAGLLLTRLTNIFKLPDVTAYLIAGLLIGPFFLGRVGLDGLGFTDYESIEQLSLISDLALGFIAFAIGTEFMLPKLKKIGRQAVTVGIIQAVVASAFVWVSLIILYFIMPDKISLPAAIVLGAVASATAPAATLMVVRQFKASGPVTDILLPVVALDDAVGLVIFAIAMGVARGIKGGDIDFVSIAINPIIEIIASLVLGALLGYALTLIERFFHSNTNRLILIIGMTILAVALSKMEIEMGAVKLSFSSLLVCMMLGTVFCNTCPLAEDLMDISEKWTSPLYCLFFVLSGAELRLDVFSDLTMVLIGVVYVVFRAGGKYFGAAFSSRATGCDSNIVKYLGITLFPQAGVALGMSLQAAELLGEDGSLIRTITLFSVLIYELIGPTLTKIALTKAGDIKPKSIEATNRRKRKLIEASHK